MKPKKNLLLCIFGILLYACAGGEAARRQLPPDDDIAGMNELSKGNDRYRKGCYPQALEHFFKAHERLVASDHIAGVAMSLNSIGNIYRAVGEIESALLFYEEASLSYLDNKNDEGALQALSNKAAALIDADRYADAQAALTRAEKLAAAGGRPFAPLLRNRGVLWLKKGDYAEALRLLGAALKITDPVDLPEVAAVNFALGTVMAKTDRVDEAMDHFEAALSADRSSSYYKGIADDLAAIGSVHHGRGDAEAAVGFFKRAVSIYALIRNKPKVDATRALLAEASQKAGINIEITQFFVERWLQGDASELPCR